MITVKPQMGARAKIKMPKSTDLVVALTQLYHVRIWEDVSRKKLLWEERIKNLVTTEGENQYLDATLKTGSYTTPTWFVGLVDNASFTAYAVGDTAAKITTVANPPTTNGWQELTAYSETVRQTWTPGTISGGSVDNSASDAVFTMNASKTIRGAFMISDDTKGGTTGILLGEVDFAAAQPVISGNVVDVVVTCVLAACP